MTIELHEFVVKAEQNSTEQFLRTQKSGRKKKQKKNSTNGYIYFADIKR